MNLEHSGAVNSIKNTYMIYNTYLKQKKTQ